MRVLQINAVYGHGSTGTIVRDIEYLCEQSGIECYVASPDVKVRNAKRGYVIGNIFDHKLHALLSRIHGKQAYFSHLPTWNLLHWMSEIKPDIVHLHNLHSNYIHLNMLLQYLAERNIKTIITLHDCWFYTGGCFHYTATDCNQWMTNCRNCPKSKQDTPAMFTKHSAQVLADRKKFLLAIPNLYVTGVSEWMAHEPLKSFLKDIPNYVIRNGVDLKIFKPTFSDIRKRIGLENKYIILGPASKWLSSVNSDVFKQFTKLMQPDEVLLLFGMHDPCKLPKNVISFGYTKDRKELAELYTCADVFANPTREDSLSLINIEAQACGTQVVTFSNTGVLDTVSKEFGRLSMTGNVTDMYLSIRKLRQQPVDLKKLREWISGKFDYKVNYLKYISLYEEICQS